MKISKQFAYGSVLLVSISFAGTSLADDNCADVRNGLMKEWALVVVGDNCQHLAPGPLGFDPGATLDGLLQCGKVAESGGSTANPFGQSCIFGNACWGARPVANWDGGPGQGKPTTPKADTYVGYCASDKVANPDPAKIGALKKQIEEGQSTLKK
jgi:hypothetical protein